VSLHDATRVGSALLVRLLFFGPLFWILAEGRVVYPLLAGLVVLAAAGASLLLVPPSTFTLSARGLIRFAPWFLAESVRGGLDVAGRTLQRHPSLEPGFVEYRLRLANPAARTFFASAVSLLPGTLSIHLRSDALRIHVLDLRHAPEARLRPLEDRVGEMFGEPMGPTELEELR
jgi:multicomponent Na+:H+ antiporter subunit E